MAGEQVRGRGPRGESAGLRRTRGAPIAGGRPAHGRDPGPAAACPGSRRARRARYPRGALAFGAVCVARAPGGGVGARIFVRRACCPPDKTVCAFCARPRASPVGVEEMGCAQRRCEGVAAARRAAPA